MPKFLQSNMAWRLRVEDQPVGGRREKEDTMRFISKWALALLPALALATPALALNDSEEPGSVIVFPKFINMPRVTVDGVLNIARTEIEVGVVCPPSVVAATPGFCAEHQPVKIRFHW